MPQAEEDALRKVADKYSAKGRLKKKSGKDGLQKAKDAFVFGIMRKRGWKPSTQKHSKAAY